MPSAIACNGKSDYMYNQESIKKGIREISDYPKKGIMFKDITTLLKEKELFREVIDKAAEMVESDTEYIVGIESRGFIFGSALAYRTGKGFIPIRKKGKLPYDKISKEYDLEYGKDTIEMHKDALHKGAKVVVVDDLLATGGTAQAAYSLVETAGGEVSSFIFLIELTELKGRERLPCKVFSLVQY